MVGEPAALYDVPNGYVLATVLFMGQIGKELRWGIHYGKSYVGGTIRGLL